MPILSSTFFVFKAAQGTVKTWFPVILSPLLSLTVSAHSFSPISFLPHHLRPPPIFYLSRGPAVTEHSVRRLRQLFLKSNKRSWKKRQEFLCSDVRLFTWRDLLLSVQSPPPCPSRLQSTKSLSRLSADFTNTSPIHIFKQHGSELFENMAFKVFLKICDKWAAVHY